MDLMARGKEAIRLKAKMLSLIKRVKEMVFQRGKFNKMDHLQI
jgi:hypothetical protein